MANWPETIYKAQDISEKADPLPEIPPMFKRDKEAEATAKQADVYVRFMQQGGVVR